MISKSLARLTNSIRRTGSLGAPFRRKIPRGSFVPSIGSVQFSATVESTSENPYPQTVPIAALRMDPDHSSTLSRIMNPDDANPAGNVHGGEILRLIDEAGRVAAMRHCNGSGQLSEPIEVCLARIDRVDFVRPIMVGEVAQVDAVVTYASQRSVEVTATVYAESLSTGERRCTNQGTLWYVGVDAKQIAPHIRRNSASGDEGVPFKPSLLPKPVPALKFASEDLETAARERYLKQKASRSSNLQAGAHGSRAFPAPPTTLQPTTFSQVMLPGHCNNAGSVHGGVLIKLMDEAGAIAAFRHCRRNNCVTASFDSLNFEAPVFTGDVVTVTGWPTYVSRRSVECEVVVTVENLKTGFKYQAVACHLTCVSLDKHGKTLDVPPLPEPTSEYEQQQRLLGKQRYEMRQAARKQAKEQAERVSSGEQA